MFISGSLTLSVLSVSSTTTLNDTHCVVLVNSGSGEVTINLPAALTCNGRFYIIKKSDSSGNGVIIDGNGSETIDVATTYSISSHKDTIRRH